MSESEILKKIDELIVQTEHNTQYCEDESDYNFELEKFYNIIQDIMQNYEKVLEVNHFKQTEL